MPVHDPELGIARRAVFEQLRAAGQPRWVRVSGSSMAPLMRPGGWALVDFGARNARIGDIVLADLGRRMVVHRLVAHPRGAPEALLLKGDAERRTDPRIRVDDVYGIVRAVRDARGRTTSVGCGGRLGRALAVSSRVAGRSTQRTARFARRVPRPLRTVLIRPAGALSRAPLRAVAAVAAARQALARGAIA
jgi:Peptidase S24-like